MSSASSSSATIPGSKSSSSSPPGSTSSKSGGDGPPSPDRPRNASRPAGDNAQSGAASATRRRVHKIAWARVSSCVGVRTSMPASCSTRSSIWTSSPSSQSAAAASEKWVHERAPIEFSDGCAREHHCLGSLPSLLIVTPACSSRCRVCGIRASVAASRWLQRGPRAAASQ